MSGTRDRIHGLATRVLGVVNRVPIGARAVPWRGHRLYADTPDRLAAAIGWRLGLLARRERRFIERVLAPGMVAVDVGANLGFHTLTMARAVGPTGVVHALEPDPRNFRLLSRAVREAGYAHVTLHAAAASDARARVALYLAAANRGDHRLTASAEARASVLVDTLVLDDLLDAAPRVDLIKIDVQGSEVAVLRGLGRTLRRHPTVRVLCECSPDLLARAGADAEAFFGPFRASGLRPRQLDRAGEPHEISETEAWRLAAAAGFETLHFSG
jgi:FkbM family methyltransferase